MSDPPATSVVPLPSIGVRSYRAFRDKAELRIRPLTLIYGRNQAGKSSLLRALPLLADSLAGGVGGLDLTSASLRGAGFRELGWLGREPNFSPWLSLSDPSGNLLSVQLVDDGGLFVNRLELGVPGDAVRLSVSFDEPVSRSPQSFKATYTGLWRGVEWTGDLSFDTLVPTGLPEGAPPIVEPILAAMASLRDLQWLHADRLGAGSGLQRRSRWCSPDGADLADVLQPHRGVIQAASEWLGSADLIGEEISLGRSERGQPRFELAGAGRERLPLYLAGEGVQCLVPVLLCACWAEQGGDAPKALVVEEPESHLHPDIQVRLTDRLLETVGRGIPVVLETHSIYILRAMQLAVAEGRLQAGDVSLHWLERDQDGAASVAWVDVESDGALTGWRPDVFEQEQKLARQILEARWTPNRGSR